MTDTFNRDGNVHFDVIARECIQFFDDNKWLVSEENNGIILMVKNWPIIPSISKRPIPAVIQF